MVQVKRFDPARGLSDMNNFLAGVHFVQALSSQNGWIMIFYMEKQK